MDAHQLLVAVREFLRPAHRAELGQMEIVHVTKPHKGEAFIDDHVELRLRGKSGKIFVVSVREER